MLQSLLGRYNGEKNTAHSWYLPMWEEFGGDTLTQLGYPSVVPLVNGVQWGIITDDKTKNTMKDATDQAANFAIHSTTEGPPMITEYRSTGYIPHGDMSLPLDKRPDHRSVSKTLEYSFEDSCILKLFNKQDPQYETYKKGSEAWQNLFRDADYLIWPKNADGSWADDID